MGAFGIWQEVHAPCVAEQEATGWLRECGLTVPCGGEEREPCLSFHHGPSILSAAFSSNRAAGVERTRFLSPSVCNLCLECRLPRTQTPHCYLGESLCELEFSSVQTFPVSVYSSVRLGRGTVSPDRGGEMMGV